MKKSKEASVKKVFAVLQKFVRGCDVKWPAKGCSVAMTHGYNPSPVIRLANGKWTCGNYDDLDGRIGGFNTNALGSMTALVQLGYFSEEDADTFRSWWGEQERTRDKQSSEDELKRLARSLGYELRKKA